MNIRTVSVTFPYSLKCVPKGCRTERKLLVRGRTTAAIRTAASDDVTKAFRVYFPTENPLRFVRPNKMTGDAYRRKAPTIDIVRCEGMVWWPWRAEDGNSAYDVGELADFIDRLEDGSDDLLTTAGGFVVVGRAGSSGPAIGRRRPVRRRDRTRSPQGARRRR
jgi:hypothetical protein